jgi:hypothetical protein
LAPAREQLLGFLNGIQDFSIGKSRRTTREQSAWKSGNSSTIKMRFSWPWRKATTFSSFGRASAVSDLRTLFHLKVYPECRTVFEMQAEREPLTSESAFFPTIRPVSIPDRRSWTGQRRRQQGWADVRRSG